MLIFGNPVEGLRIVPLTEERSPSDVLPNGRPAFRVTQRFDDVNPAFPHLGNHKALDLGNFNCGDNVLAAASGTARTFKDSAGALIVVIRHDDGFETVYAHLARYLITTGSSVPVLRGQRIAVVGNTGLGATCHLHFEIKQNGVHVDPWPFMNGGPDVNIRGTWQDHISNRRTELSIGSNFREGPGLKDFIITQFPAGTGVIPVIRVSGNTVGTRPDANVWYGAWLYAGGWKFGYLHSSVLKRTADDTAVLFTKIEIGYTAAQLRAAKQSGGKAVASAAATAAAAL